MDRIDRTGILGHFLLRNFKSKIMNFTSKRITTWSIKLLYFFPYRFQPFSALCIYLKFQEKILHFIFAAIRSRLNYSDPRHRFSTDLKVAFNFHSSFSDDSEKHFIAYMLNFILALSCKFCIFCDFSGQHAIPPNPKYSETNHFRLSCLKISIKNTFRNINN